MAPLLKKALGYIRVSGRSQATDGTGLEEQKAQIIAWAERNGYEIVEWFADAGVTGELPWDERPAMRSLVERLAVNGINAVIVHHMDRIGRGKSAIFEDFLTVVGEASIAVISVVDGLLTPAEGADEFQNADQDMMLSIKMAVIRNEKRKLVARMRLGRIRAKAAGKHVDGAYAFGSDPNLSEESVTLARMRQLHGAGLTCYRICKILDSEGRRPRRAAKWVPNVVQSILDKGEKQ